MLCGEIHLVQDEWRILFTCSICGKVMEDLDEFLTHTLGTHLPGVSPEKLTELLNACRRRKGNISVLDEHVTPVAAVQEPQEEVVADTKYLLYEAKMRVDDFTIQLDDNIMHNARKDLSTAATVARKSQEQLDAYNKDLNYETQLKDETLTEPQADKGQRRTGLRKRNTKNPIAVTDQQFKIEIKDEDFTDDTSMDDVKANTSTDASEDECNIPLAALTSNKANFEMVLLDDSTTAKKSKTKNRKIPQSRPRPFVCPVCAESFVRGYLLKNHFRSHANYKPYACEQCDASFKTQDGLKNHSKRHFGYKPFQCKHCSERFASSSELKLHKRSHTPERRHKCPECERAFRNTSQLNKHRRRHSNDRPYLCTLCGKRFYDGKLLRGHMLTHSDVRKYPCSHCNMAFKSGKNLNQHLKLHSDAKDYTCKYCPKKFAQCSGMHAHMKSNHSNIHKINTRDVTY